MPQGVLNVKRIEVQKWLGKLKKQNVEVNKVFLEAVKTQLPSICACLGV